MMEGEDMTAQTLASTPAGCLPETTTTNRRKRRTDTLLCEDGTILKTSMRSEAYFVYLHWL
jgi:hypothetical protein